MSNEGRDAARRKRSEKPYTVVGDDRSQPWETFVDWVWAATSIEAVWIVMEQRNIHENDVIAVFAGHHVDLNPTLAASLELETEQ